MREEPQDGREPGEASRRAAQDTAGELARMGIDPELLGLEPLPPEPFEPHPAGSGGGGWDEAARFGPTAPGSGPPAPRPYSGPPAPASPSYPGPPAPASPSYPGLPAPGSPSYPGLPAPASRPHSGPPAQPHSGPPGPVSGAGSWWVGRGGENWPPPADPWLDTAGEPTGDTAPVRPVPGGWAPPGPAEAGWLQSPAPPGPAPGGWAPPPSGPDRSGGWAHAQPGGPAPAGEWESTGPTPPTGWAPGPGYPTWSPAGEPTAASGGWTGPTAPGPGPASALSRPLAFPRDSQPTGPARAPAEAWEAERRSILAEERQGIVVPSGWRRAVRAATFGLLAPGAAEVVERERELVARVRARRRQARVIAFVAGTGGAGTTTTAAGTGLTLAALRTDGILVFDARCGTASLGRRLGGPAGPCAGDLAAEPRPGQEPVLPLNLRSGLHVIDGAPWHVPAAGDRLVEVIALMRDRYSMTLLDIGNDVTEPGQAALARADQVVVVAAARRDAVDAVRTALGRIHQADPYQVATATVALVQLSTGGYRRAADLLRAELGIAPQRLVPVPYDPVLAAGDQVEPWRLRPAAREAYLRIAAVVADPGRAAPVPAARAEQAAW